MPRSWTKEPNKTGSLIIQARVHEWASITPLGNPIRTFKMEKCTTSIVYDHPHLLKCEQRWWGMINICGTQLEQCHSLFCIQFLQDKHACSSLVLKKQSRKLLRVTYNYQPSDLQANIDAQKFSSKPFSSSPHTPLAPFPPPSYSRPPPAPSSREMSLALPIAIRGTPSCRLPKSDPRWEQCQLILLWLFGIAS